MMKNYQFKSILLKVNDFFSMNIFFFGFSTIGPLNFYYKKIKYLYLFRQQKWFALKKNWRVRTARLNFKSFISKKIRSSGCQLCNHFAFFSLFVVLLFLPLSLLFAHFILFLRVSTLPLSSFRSSHSQDHSKHHSFSINQL